MNKRVDMGTNEKANSKLGMIEKFFGIGVGEKRKSITDEQRKTVYDFPDSFAQFFRILRFDRDLDLFVMDDEISVGAAIEVEHHAAEDRSIEDNYDQHEKFMAVFENMPERKENPYVIATYSQEEPLIELLDQTKKYAAKMSKADDALGKDYRQIIDEHFEDLSQEGGMFKDGLQSWRGVCRRTRILVYRRFNQSTERDVEANAKEIHILMERIFNGLNSAGIRAKKMDDDAMYRWLNPWFSNEETDKEKYDKVVRNPYEEDKSIDGAPDYESDILDWILDSSPPISGTHKPEDGTWKWGSDYVRYIPIVGSKKRPVLGGITTTASEKKNIAQKDEMQKRPLFFRLPRGAVYTLIFVCTTQDSESDKLNVIAKSARAASREAKAAMQFIDPAIEAMVRGHKLFPTYHGFYIRAKTKEACLDESRKAIAEIQVEGFRCIELEDDLHALDEAVKSLPFAYEPQYDKYLMRQYPMWLHDIISLMPIWGQSQVNGHPGINYFDRLGNPIIFDPLSSDRARVAHLFMGGASGSGKSANLNYILWSLYCIHRPRQFIVDYGGSYRLLAEYLTSLGVKVKYRKCEPSDPAQFALYGEAIRYLEEERKAAAFIASQNDDEDDEDEDGEDDQDFLTQAAFVTKLMVSGGDEKAFNNMTNAHTAIIKQCIVVAAKKRLESKEHTQLLPQDVSEAIRERAEVEKIEKRKIEFMEMSDAILHYTMGFYGKMFNQYVKPAEDFDAEILDVGILGTNTEYNDAFILAWVGILNQLEVISADAVKRGVERDTLLVNDEAHITMEVPMMPSVLARKAKVFRKQAIWMILATQELEDIPPAAKKIVGMTEWRIFMSMNRDQLEQLERFVDLDEEQKNLILSTKTKPGVYTEGVLFSQNFSPQVFRNIPPAIALAFGQTEKKERTNRNKIRDEHGYTTETEVTRHVARQIRAGRRNHA